MSQGRVNPNKTLENQGITGLGSVHYNLMEPDLVQQSLCRRSARAKATEPMAGATSAGSA